MNSEFVLKSENKSKNRSLKIASSENAFSKFLLKNTHS